MDDYISREGTAEAIEGLPFNMSFALSKDELNGMNRAKTVIAHYILSAIPAADVVPVVRCKDCVHRPSGTGVNHDIQFPDDVCPCQCEDTWYSWMPRDDWYCAYGRAE